MICYICLLKMLIFHSYVEFQMVLNKLSACLVFHLPAAVLTHSNQLTSTSNFQRRPNGSLYLPQKAFRWDCHEESPIGMKIIGYSAQKPLFGMTKISNYPLKSMVSGMMSLFHIIQNYPFIKIIPYYPQIIGYPRHPIFSNIYSWI